MQPAILRTLAYFDIFAYPVTLLELHCFLWGTAPNTLSDVLDTLRYLTAAKQIEEHNGRYCLFGRSEIISLHSQRIHALDTKLAIANHAGRLCRFVPFLQAFFVCNTVAQGTAEKDSDIDVFIIIRHGRLWLARLMTTLLLSLFRLRRHGRYITDRVCLSFYATDDALNLSTLAIPGGDPYLTYWIHQLIPIFDPNTLYETIQKENHWTKKFLPNATHAFYPAPKIRVEDTPVSKSVRRLVETLWSGKYGDLLEKHARGIQLQKMKQKTHPRGSSNPTHVVVSDTLLKFHEQDRREQFRDEWQRRCNHLGLSN